MMRFKKKTMLKVVLERNNKAIMTRHGNTPRSHGCNVKLRSCGENTKHTIV